MSKRRLTALVVVFVAAFIAALLLVLRWTGPAVPEPRVAPEPPAVVDAAPPSLAPPMAPPSPPAGDCPPSLRDAETAPGPRFDERWAMCRLFGNYDGKERSSAAEAERATLALSSGFEERGRARHVLVVARRPLDRSVPGRGTSARLDIHVYARDEGGWRHEASGAGIAESGEGGRDPALELLRVGRERSALLVRPAGGQAEGPARLVGISEGRVAILADDLPAGGEGEPDCVPIRCFSWRAELSFSRARGEYDDLLVHVHGTRPDDDERVWKVDETQRWIYRAGRYVPEP